MCAIYLKKVNKDGYDRFLLCLSFESFFEQIKGIEEMASMRDLSGKILIDQLFITGNGQNRFLSCNYKNGKIDFGTAQIVNPSIDFRKETVDWLHSNYDYVENSILTEDQREKVKEDIAF
jgi:hypothetical protein